MVGVHEHQHELHTDELMLRRLEELEALIKKQTTGIQTTKPNNVMIGMDKDGNALEPHPPMPADDTNDEDNDEGHDEEMSGETEEADMADGGLDDSKESG